MILLLVSVAQFLIALDYSITYIALPSIAAELGLEPALAQWVVSAYAVLFAGFLVVGGRLTDRLGPQRMYVGALILFGAASAAGGFAQDGALLLAARAVQGLGAALLQPAVLGLIGTTYAPGRRARAVAVWGSVGAAGLAAGAILGGVLTAISWRLTFMINVPLTLLCALAALSLPHAERNNAERIPVRAAGLGTGAVLAVALGLTLAADQRWSIAIGAVALGGVLLAAFVATERRGRNVLIANALRRIPSLRTGAAATALYMASVGSEFYLLTLLLQDGKGYGPLEAGLAFLPLAALVTVGSTTAGRLIRRHQPRHVLLGGFVVAAIGLGSLVLTLPGDDYARHLLPGLLLSGFGHGAIYTSMFTLGTHDVPTEHQGTAGALLTTSQYLAGALTIAVLTIVLGPDPTDGQFRAAFLLTAAAAAGGAAIAAKRTGHRFPDLSTVDPAAARRKDHKGR
ncbi:MFS transporter [Tenggerimyces flavus]|uniref:MFS transporter n=1 Tax=Tenggerimyces flavus TaxID=1708749 RepID=A0ABV7YM17_9ACTN|nr:MFS transporter [Tenggerimyces flavus]MBM7787795.1 MFS family permease [Tenggerimyces flavus]